MKKGSSALIGIALLLTGCATAYQPHSFSGGFTETQLATNVWRVAFKGNGATQGERAEDFAMLRSAELALKHGFTHFAFSESRSDSEVITFAEPTKSYTTANATVNGRNVYGNATTTTYGGDTFSIFKPSTTNVVVMFQGKPNVNGMVFDAQFICKSLGQKYKVVCNASQG